VDFRIEKQTFVVLQQFCWVLGFDTDYLTDSFAWHIEGAIFELILNGFNGQGNTSWWCDPHIELIGGSDGSSQNQSCHAQSLVRGILRYSFPPCLS